MPIPVRLATVRRGTAIEAVVRGHAAVVGGDGRLVAAVGDAASTTTLRSCVKPIQALPFTGHGLDAIGAGDEELAVACASHNGEPRHVATVRRLLSLCGIGPEALSCGPQLPYDEESARQVLLSGGGGSAVHNNCSGKHAAMLATCVARGWPIHGYASAGHPLQVEISELLGRLAATDLATAPRGIDGCGLPTYGLPLHALARIFAAAPSEAGFRRCQEAMAGHPGLVAGRGRFDTALLGVAGAAITVKGGGAAVWVALRRGGGPALAIKLEAGEAAALPAVAMEALGTLGWLDARTLGDPRLAQFRQPVLRNWAGDAVGSISVDPGWSEVLR